MRSAIYARYSSANQREASIADRVEACTRYVDKQGWAIVGTYTMPRPVARRASVLDTRSCCPTSIAAFSTLSSSKHSIVSAASWPILPISTTAAHSPASSFTPSMLARSVPCTSACSARWRNFISRICARRPGAGSLAGRSKAGFRAARPMAMMSRAYALNNSLYAGRLEWNRCSYIKDPRTGKRVARPNPRSKWEIIQVPHLQIVEHVLWDRVKARQEEVSFEIGRNEDGNALNRAPAPLPAERSPGLRLLWRHIHDHRAGSVRLAASGTRARARSANGEVAPIAAIR